MESSNPYGMQVGDRVTLLSVVGDDRITFVVSGFTDDGKPIADSCRWSLKGIPDDCEYAAARAARIDATAWFFTSNKK